MKFDTIQRRVNRNLKIKNYAIVNSIYKEIFSLMKEDLLKGKAVKINEFISLKKEIMKARNYKPPIGPIVKKGNYYKIKVTFSSKFKDALKSQKIYTGE